MSSDPTSTIILDDFYPSCISILRTQQTEKSVIIQMKSNTREEICPECGHSTRNIHSTYHRKIQDIPLFQKKGILDVTAHRYYCDHPQCQQKVFAENLDGFSGKYGRMTERLETLIVTIAENTSCEGCAKICKCMGIDVSGDTVIKLLKQYFEKKHIQSSDIIGIDDWAIRKGHHYGTIICDGKTNKPVALLEGRDGSELKKWLSQNPHIKTITRDRASAYAKVISEVLPDAMQIADRFHLYQNLLKVVRDAITNEIPNRISIKDPDSCTAEIEQKPDNSKKK